MAIKISGTNAINDDKSFVTVADTTENRPGSPVVGMIRYNTTLAAYEYYDGSTWKLVAGNGGTPNAYAWGNGGNGRLGNGTTVNTSSPVSVVGGFTDWIQVDTSSHNIGLRANGTLWSWGVNTNGRLGDGTTVAKSSPVSVVGGFTDWIQVSAGDTNSLGVRANGTAWSWGAGGVGRLGNGTTVDRSSPVSVVGGFTNWIQVSGRDGRGHGLRANGTIWSWGLNTNGRLGDGTTVNKSSPVSVVGGFTNWIQVSAGSTHSAGVRANGTIWSWGGGVAIGDGTTVGKSSPVSVVGGFTDWIQVSCEAHSIGLRANGTVWGWGPNVGRLGDGTTTSRSSPVSVIGGFTDWVQVTAGSTHSLGIRANGTLWGWGGGSAIGDNLTVLRLSPVSVVGGFTDWIQVDSSAHTIGLRS